MRRIVFAELQQCPSCLAVPVCSGALFATLSLAGADGERGCQ